MDSAQLADSRIKNLAASLGPIIKDGIPEMEFRFERINWSNLHTGFDRRKYKDDKELNIALREHLSDRWRKASYDEKLELASFIVRDWGGIRAIKDHKLMEHISKADTTTEREAPFNVISSYSKIISFKTPNEYAIYDARVAAALNALQLLFDVAADAKIYFHIPQSQNRIIKELSDVFSERVLKNHGFFAWNKDDAYGLYLKLLRQISSSIDQQILLIEMWIWSFSVALCDEALRERARLLPQ